MEQFPAVRYIFFLSAKGRSKDATPSGLGILLEIERTY
jgi:hypothetical protein